MDWLLEIEAEIAEQVYWSVATLLNLEVDLLFFDTTSTYFETDEADPPSDGAPKGFRTFGHSKDHRPDLPQVVIGLAVTRTGIPIRVWTFPGNTADQALIRQVKDDLLAWKLGRVVWVTDRGFASAREPALPPARRRPLHQRREAALARAPRPRRRSPAQGRYHIVAGNLEVKEVVLDDGTMRDRFVVCRNPDEAVRDAAIRERLLAAARGRDRRLATTLDPAAREQARLRPARDARPTARFLRVTKAGPAAHRPGRGGSRRAARRQVPAAHVRPDPVGGGRRDSGTSSSSRSSGAGGT